MTRCNFVVSTEHTPAKREARGPTTRRIGVQEALSALRGDLEARLADPEATITVLERADPWERTVTLATVHDRQRTTQAIEASFDALELYVVDTISWDPEG
jgi:hypothetical protein